MAKRSVFFYQVKWFDNQHREFYDPNLSKNVIQTIMDNHGVVYGEYDILGTGLEQYYSVDLTADNEDFHTVIDIYHQDDYRMLCRLSRQQPSNQMLMRNYHNFQPQNLNVDDFNNGIEKYTYAVIDYNNGICAIVAAKSAPDVKSLKAMIESFSNYTVDMTPIPNQNGISSIYEGEDSELTKIEIEVPLPNPDILTNIFKWSDTEVQNSLKNDTLTASITIKDIGRAHSITTGRDAARALIDNIKHWNWWYKKVKVTGRARNVKLQEFDLNEHYFSYPIDITSYYIESNQRKLYSLIEMTKIYKDNLYESLAKNDPILINFRPNQG